MTRVQFLEEALIFLFIAMTSLVLGARPVSYPVGIQGKAAGV
jgi:hypothetical protein